jgi:hypothetical protein
MRKKYIVLARLDDRPELLFGLHQMDEKDLIAAVVCRCP